MAWPKSDTSSHSSGHRKLSNSSRFCTTRDGVRIAFSTSGQGPAVVRAAHFLTHLDHDFGSPVWRPWLDELGGNRTLVRYDGRGCGLSDPAPGPLDIEAWLSDLEAVVEAAGLERFALFGCSQGAAVSIAYAARHPERVTCLALLGGYARGTLRRNPDAEQRKRARVLLDLVEVGWGQDNPAFRQVFTGLFIPDGTPEQVHWFNELERLSCTPEHAMRTMAAFGQIDVSDDASRVQCPTLVLHARGDARAPFVEGRHMASLIPGAEFIPLDSRNHVLLRHEPAFAEAFGHINHFLDAHQRAQSAHHAAFASLTPRERELLELLAHGLDNLQMSVHLGLSEKTVRNKVSLIFDKLQVESRSQAIVRSREAGFGASDLPR